MKAFTVYQPYAHAIVAGVKHYETRPRRTHIRGRVAVHAGRLDEVQATKHLTNGEFWAVLEAAGGGGNLPRGAVIGTLKSPIACLWKNLWTVWITGNAC